MEKVKSALEKALEKAAELGELTPEEKETLRDREKCKAVLADFYKGDLKRDELWQRLKGINPLLLKEAQINMIESLRLGSFPEDTQLKKDGILAIESLKEIPDTPMVENYLNSIAELQKECAEMKEKVVEEVRAAVEQNPQLSMRPVKTPDGRKVMQAAVSIDEAVQAQLTEFLPRQEEKYEEMFSRVIEEFKRLLK